MAPRRRQSGPNPARAAATAAARRARNGTAVSVRESSDSTENANPPAARPDDLADDDISVAPTTTGLAARQTIRAPPPVPVTVQSLRLREWSQKIPARTVTGRWGFLSPAGQTAVQAVLTNAARTVTQSAGAGNEGRAARRAEEAEEVVDQIVRKLSRSLPRVRVPVQKRRQLAARSGRRSGREDRDGLADLFDLEVLSKRVARLEGELTTVLDAIKLADEEIEHGQDELRMTRELTAELKANADGMNRQWARRKQQMPLFVQKIPDTDPNTALAGKRGIPSLRVADPCANLQKYLSQVQPEGPTGPSADPALSGLLQTLSSHVSSLEANQQPVKGLAEVLVRAESSIERAMQTRSPSESDMIGWLKNIASAAPSADPVEKTTFV